MDAEHVSSIPHLNGGVPGRKASNAAQDCALAVLPLQDVVFPAGISGIVGRPRDCPSDSLVPLRDRAISNLVFLRIGLH